MATCFNHWPQNIEILLCKGVCQYYRPAKRKIAKYLFCYVQIKTVTASLIHSALLQKADSLLQTNRWNSTSTSQILWFNEAFCRLNYTSFIDNQAKTEQENLLVYRMLSEISQSNLAFNSIKSMKSGELTNYCDPIRWEYFDLLPRETVKYSEIFWSNIRTWDNKPCILHW